MSRDINVIKNIKNVKGVIFVIKQYLFKIHINMHFKLHKTTR